MVYLSGVIYDEKLSVPDTYIVLGKPITTLNLTLGIVQMFIVDELIIFMLGLRVMIVTLTTIRRVKEILSLPEEVQLSAGPCSNSAQLPNGT